MFFRDSAYQVNETIHPSELSPESPYIGLEHIEQETLQLIGIENASKVTSNKKIFKKGDILFGKLRPYFRKVIITDFDGICSTDIWVIRPKENIDKKFLYYWCANWKFINFINSASEGTRMPRAKWEVAINHEIPNHTYENQKIIGNILGSLDEKIEINKKTNETLEEISKALFKSWFIDFDPVRAKVEGRSTGLSDEISQLFPDSFEDSELGEIPSGWKLKSLDQIAHYLNGLALQKFAPKGDHTDLPVIKIAQLRKGDAIGSDKCSNELGDEYVIRDGDVLFSWSGSLLVDMWTGGKGALNQHLFKVTSTEYKKWIYFYWTKYHLNEFQSIAKSKATTMGHIQRKHLTEAKVVIPPENYFKKMNINFGILIERQLNTRLESKTLAEIRDTLLPKLISGELRIPDAEKMLEKVGL